MQYLLNIYNKRIYPNVRIVENSEVAKSCLH